MASMPTAQAAIEGAFEKAVRIALEIVAVLECPRLALVDVDRQQARSRLGRHQFPFAAGGEAGAAEAAQARVFHHRDDVCRCLAPGDARGGKRVAARRAVGGVINVAGSDAAADRDASRDRRQRPPTPAQRSRAGSDAGRRRRPVRSRSGRRTARATRARPRRAGSAAWPAARVRPASSQAIESQTRTVIAGGGVSPSFTTSKWW